MHPDMERLTIEEHNGKKIIFVNYSGLKEAGMIELVNRHRELTLQTALPFLADYRKTYVSPAYMIHAKRFVETTKHTIDKGAFLGVDRVKSMILKGILLVYGVNYKTFESKEDAIAFLADSTPTP